MESRSLTPAWELIVPDQGVTAEELPCLLCNVGNSVTAAVAETPLAGLRVGPFLAVGGSDGPELIGVPGDSHVLLVVQGRIIYCCPKVLEPGSFGQLVQLAVG